MEEEVEVPVVKGALKLGVIVGVVSVILTFIAYVVDSTLFANWWFNLGIGLITLVAVVVLGISFRNSNGGYMSFGQAFLFCFLTFAVAGLLSALFNILLYTVIDTELAEFVVNETIRKTTEVYEKLGLPQAQVDEQIETMENDLRAGFTPAGFIKNYLLVMIGYAVLSLITGLIVKKNEPIEDY